MDNIHYLDISELGKQLRIGGLSSVAVTSALLRRISEKDPRLNSYITVTSDLAMAQAEAADRELREGLDRGPLHGVPLAIKDIFDLQGFPTTAGMPIRSGTLATEDATVVDRLKRAGAVILGKNNLTEGVYAEHREGFGSPVNPWNPTRWPGASSSGSGVATAAGLCFGAIGSDTGGSIRLPSAANGITGLKPTWGRVSRHGVFELAATLDHVGPMARSAADAASILGIIAGQDAADPTAASLPVPRYLEELSGSVEGLRIGIDSKWISEKVDGPTVQALYAATATLESLGANTTSVEFPDPTQIVWDWFQVCAVQTALAHEATYPVRAEEYGSALKALLEIGRGMTGLDYQRVIMRRERFRGQVQALFSEVDLSGDSRAGLPDADGHPNEERKRRDDLRSSSLYVLVHDVRTSDDHHARRLRGRWNADRGAIRRALVPRGTPRARWPCLSIGHRLASSSSRAVTCNRSRGGNSGPIRL
jgi:amidase